MAAAITTTAMFASAAVIAAATTAAVAMAGPERPEEARRHTTCPTRWRRHFPRRFPGSRLVPPLLPQALLPPASVLLPPHWSSSSRGSRPPAPPPATSSPCEEEDPAAVLQWGARRNQPGRDQGPVGAARFSTCGAARATEGGSGLKTRCNATGAQANQPCGLGRRRR
jgi:hypothetical protein